MLKKPIKKELKITIPKHVAIIMDGNNRWTKKKKLSSFMGHQEGINSIRTTVKTAKTYGIKYLTLYSFSTENWSRPKKEVNFLMNLLRKYLSKKVKKLMKDNISIRMIGDKKRLQKDIEKKIVTKKTLNLKK